jgi:prepilin-type N-terminal cleavage/methylation domain-containing protein
MEKLRSMTRRGFTLVEILTVLIILGILMALLIPAVHHAITVSRIATMKLNFQAISTALENYKSDFRDYPKNPFALQDVTNKAGSDAYGPGPGRIDASLAMALLGPGPMAVVQGGSSSTFGQSSGYANFDMDGADGPGFRSTMALYQSATLPGGANAGATSITINSALPAAPTTPTSPWFTVVSLGGPGSPDALVPVQSFTVGGSTVTLAVPLQGTYPAGTSVALLTPTGKTWGPYLPVDKFKISYVTGIISPPPPFSPQTPVTLPVLQDIWGGPILYFPAYNSYANHVTSVPSKYNPSPSISIPSTETVLVGPLLGSPSGNSAAYQYNSPLNSSGQTGPSVFWSGPLGWFGGSPASATTPFNTTQVQALLYKLGDLSANNVIDPVGTTPAESLAVSSQYFLVSPGPDGAFTDFGTAPQTQWSQINSKSDDVYSFEP